MWKSKDSHPRPAKECPGLSTQVSEKAGRYLDSDGTSMKVWGSKAERQGDPKFPASTWNESRINVCLQGSGRGPALADHQVPTAQRQNVPRV